jgi:hypothetical protein
MYGACLPTLTSSISCKPLPEGDLGFQRFRWLLLLLPLISNLSLETIALNILTGPGRVYPVPRWTDRDETPGAGLVGCSPRQ